jgi:hypothetical protein
MAAADDDDIKTFRVIHGTAPGWRGPSGKGRRLYGRVSGVQII